jgi:hypothetical protein
MEERREKMAKRTSKTIHSVPFSSSLGAKKLIPFLPPFFLASIKGAFV